MWVLTENGELINLDRFYGVDVRLAYQSVVARSERDFVVLCFCDDAEHGREIIRHIADALANGVELYDIRNAKVDVYTCGVCALRFEVPRRGGNVHFLRGNVVCPDCWATGQDEVSVVLCSCDNEEHGEEAGGAVQ